MGEIGSFRTGAVGQPLSYRYGAKTYEEYIELVKLDIWIQMGLEVTEDERKRWEEHVNAERKAER